MKNQVKTSLAAAMIAAVAAGPGWAADLLTYGGGQCVFVGSSDLMSIPTNAGLTEAVVLKMDEAIAVAASEEWIFSPRPAFLWASEAKVACGKAYGYLKNAYRDEEYINKCDCFHSRMLQYMN